MKTKSTKHLRTHHLLLASMLLAGAGQGLLADADAPRQIRPPTLDAQGRFWVYRNGPVHPIMPFVPYGWMSDVTNLTKLIQVDLECSDKPNTGSKTAGTQEKIGSPEKPGPEKAVPDKPVQEKPTVPALPEKPAAPEKPAPEKVGAPEKVAPEKAKAPEKPSGTEKEQCIRMKLTWGDATWASVAFISGPAKPPWWGESNAGRYFNLGELPKKKLVYSVRGDRGGERIKIQIGALGDKPFGDSLPKSIVSEELTLTQDWKRHELDLKEIPTSELAHICNGFGVTAERASQPGSTAETQFYIDDVYFE